MKLKEALIAYNPNSNQIVVGPPVKDGSIDWTRHPVRLFRSVGAAFAHVRKYEGIEARHYIMSEFITIVVRDGVDLAAAHREFLKIDEYREAIPFDMIGA